MKVVKEIKGESNELILIQIKAVQDEVKGIWIRFDDKAFIVEPDNGEYWTLEELQSFVGGYVELVRPMGSQWTQREAYKDVLALNEEGKLYGLPVNRLASDIAFDQDFTWDFVAGDALLTNEKYMN